MPSIIYNNLPFPEDDLTDIHRNFALGRFMTAWSQVESISGFLFREFSEMPHETSSIIFDRVGTREQIEIVTAFCAVKLDASHQASAETVFSDVEKISIRRNKIVHAGWGSFDGEPARFWHGLTSANLIDIAHDAPKGKSLRDRYIHTVTDLSKLTDKCVETSKNISALMQHSSSRKFEQRFSQVADLRREMLEQARQHRQGSQHPPQPSDD